MKRRLILSTLLVGSLLPAVSAWGATPPAGPTSQTQLTQILTQAVTLNQLPKGLTPNPFKMDVTQPWLYSGLMYAANEHCFSASNLSTLASPKPCLSGNLKSPTTIVLIGSSAVGSWTPAMRIAAATLNVRFASFQYEACDLAALDGLRANCQTFHRNLPAAIKKLHPTLIIGVGGTNSGTDAVNLVYEQRLAITFDAVRAASPTAKLALWGTTPQLKIADATCLLARPRAIASCGVTYSPARSGVGEYGSVISRDVASAVLAKATLVPVQQWFCYNNHCPAVIGSNVVFADHMHVTEAYSKTLGYLVTATIRHLLSATP